METITDPKQLQAGKWYACAFIPLDSDRPDFGGAQIYQYLGEGFWVDEDGEVERLWDPVLQTWVAMDAADAYAEQC